jgi:hypothetical protein
MPEVLPFKEKRHFFHFECWDDGEWLPLYVGEVSFEKEQEKPVSVYQLQDALADQFIPKIVESGMFIYDGHVVHVTSFRAYRFKVYEEEGK